MHRDIPKANPRAAPSGLPSEHPLASDSPQGELFPGLPLAFPQSQTGCYMLISRVLYSHGRISVDLDPLPVYCAVYKHTCTSYRWNWSSRR